MPRPLRAAAALVLFSVLAGCSYAESDGRGTGAVEANAAPDAGNTTVSPLPRGPDAWAGQTELVLFEGAVQADDCDVSGADPTVPQATVGCANIDLGDGFAIPEGTAAVRIEADASGATRQGLYYACFYTVERNTPALADGEPTSEAVHTWRFPVSPNDWDPPQRERTNAYACYWPGGSPGANVLLGSIQTRIVAERVPDWQPTPFPDPWTAPGRRMPQPGALTLLDSNASLAYPAAVDGWVTGEGYSDAVALQGLVPAGATHLVVAVRWGAVDGCLAAGVCHVRMPIESASLWIGQGAADSNEEADAHRILAYAVPGLAEPDTLYANRSATRLWPWIDQCAQAAYCSEPPSQDLRTDVRYLVEAWRTQPDLSAVKARLGVS